MNYGFHAEAEEELNQAIDYYNECQPSLGWDFASEVYTAMQNIVNHPKAWTRLSKNTRRCLINRFPYGVIYQIVENSILIIAVMQLNRKPGYWRERMV